MQITVLSLMMILQASSPSAHCNDLSSSVKDLCLAGYTQPTSAATQITEKDDIDVTAEAADAAIQATQDAIDATEAAAQATAEAADAAADGALAASEEAERKQALMEFRNGWQRIVVSSTNSSWYVKGADLFSVSGISKPIWIKTDHSRDKTTNYRTAMRLFQFDCKSRKAQKLSMTTYAPDGSVKYSDQISYPKWEYTVPDSVLDQALTVICKN